MPTDKIDSSAKLTQAILLRILKDTDYFPEEKKRELYHYIASMEDKEILLLADLLTVWRYQEG